MTETKNVGGRPEFKPTQAMRRKVAIAAGGGMSHEQIAIALGIARGTLLKYFPDELTRGAYTKRMELLDVLHKTAKKGSVAAAREYFKHEPGVTAPPVPLEKPEPKKGKKEQAAEEAQVAAVGTDWEDLLNHPDRLQ